MGIPNNPRREERIRTPWVISKIILKGEAPRVSLNIPDDYLLNEGLDIGNRGNSGSPGSSARISQRTNLWNVSYDGGFWENFGKSGRRFCRRLSFNNAETEYELKG
ncbi:hypothetical protein JTB14_031143 [Gonioctena quinquepunctata]|nr:hypothetical protein JTB14_031143 [Gonioctena quinquepunctata]